MTIKSPKPKSKTAALRRVDMLENVDLLAAAAGLETAYDNVVFLNFKQDEGDEE